MWIEYAQYRVPGYRRPPRFASISGACAALAILALSPESAAYAPKAGAHSQVTFEVASGPTPRRARSFRGQATTSAASTALRQLEADLGPTWTRWDAATGVPSYVIPRGHSSEGISADPSRARTFADGLLTTHLDLLAPGCSRADFTMVSNREDRGLRTVGFVQRYGGREVVGGQLSLRIRNNHVSAIVSQAIPCAALPTGKVLISDAKASQSARAWIAEAEAAAQTTAVNIGDPVILPRIGDTAILSADLVIPVIVETSTPKGRWRVYIDATTGAPTARESLLHYAADVRYNVPKRGPQGARYNAPPALVILNSGGQELLTDANGVLAIDVPTQLNATVQGPLATVINEAGEAATSDWVLSPGETLVWDQHSNELIDAQLSAFVHTMLVKQHVFAIDPNNAFLAKQIAVYVNIADVCNAFSDGNSINFFMSGDGCANTARISDVIYHEFGHSVHTESLIPGVGAFHGALSEGISDYLGATITGDSGLARGFFSDQPGEPLREIDPEGYEWHWPEDQGEVHDEGRIIAGALWDLRKILRGKLGAAAGAAHTDMLWYESIRRAVDLPSMYMESLIADDDDGLLSNGTPNGCEIAAAYGAHGLRTIEVEVSDVSLEPESPAGYPVHVSSDSVLGGCPGGGPQGASLRWRLRGQPGTEGTLAMTSDGIGGFTGLIPSQVDGVVVQYQVEVKTASNTTQQKPSNAADPWYEFYVGDVEPIYCTDFESDPFVENWSISGVSSDFEWAAPGGISGLDPDAAFSGLMAIGNDITNDGGYDSFADGLLVSPSVGTGDYSTVRLQYRRWLSVEDGFYDQARIYAGGSTVWENRASDIEFDADVHHVDGEWRFHDVDLSAAILDGTVSVAFALQTDGGLELGGWTIDDLCIVGVKPAAGICGDGFVDPGEGCDDGNNLGGDGCSATCQPEVVGETDSDTGTGTGTGTDTDTDTDTDTGATGGAGFDLVDRGCTCTTSRPTPGERAPWLALLLLLGLRRRRR